MSRAHACWPTRLGRGLHADAFTDAQIEAWVRVYFEQGHEGDVDGLVAFIEAEQAAGRGTRG